MLAEGARQLAQGKRPAFSDLLLTPGNALRVAEQLSQLRGAAMKVGQLLSMDAGNLLPSELSDMLSRLRSDAHPMPMSQLVGVLDENWGKGWEGRFEQFSFTPLAAASIGQVHAARGKDGQRLAIKVQYPGVRESISSDVDNVATLLRMSGLLPHGMDVAPLLQEAKLQLQNEADYLKEAMYLQRFHQQLADSPDFLVPLGHAEFSTPNILVMSFADGVALRPLNTHPRQSATGSSPCCSACFCVRCLSFNASRPTLTLLIIVISKTPGRLCCSILVPRAFMAATAPRHFGNCWLQACVKTAQPSAKQRWKLATFSMKPCPGIVYC